MPTTTSGGERRNKTRRVNFCENLTTEEHAETSYWYSILLWIWNQGPSIVSASSTSTITKFVVFAMCSKH